MKFQGCFKWFTTCIVIQAICCSADMGIVPNAAPATTINGEVVDSAPLRINEAI